MTKLPAAVLSGTVIQMWRMMPGPSMSASVMVSPDSRGTQHEPLRPTPRWLADMAARPFSPVMFSGVMARLSSPPCIHTSLRNSLIVDLLYSSSSYSAELAPFT